MKRVTTILLVLLSLVITREALAANADSSAKKPNFIIIFTDDQGYNDLGCFGSAKIRTPRIDRMAKEGIRMSSFYTGAPVCGPSRAAIMTGCYPQRVAQMRKQGDYHTILDNSEITIAEVLKKAGYSTMAIGKWHLAGSGGQAIGTDKTKKGLAAFKMNNPDRMPLAQGFDSYFGIPYSNDMRPSVLMRDKEFVEAPVKQEGISTRYTDEAITFIEKNKDRPFFLYLAHAMPHTPLYPSKEFAGKSPYGIYGDCIEEIDWNTGRIIDKLRELGIDDNTMIVFCSDNGPWLEGSKNRVPEATRSLFQSGTAKPLRGYKMTTWDGGPRVPCVIRWPGTIPAGRESDEIAMTMDLLPTMARAAGTTEPADRVIDGRDILPLLSGKVQKSPHDAYYFYKHNHLHGVRSGKWKLVLPRPAKPRDLGWYGRLQEEVKEISLYDLHADIGETTNVAPANPDVVKDLMRYVQRARADLGDRNVKGCNLRGSRK